MNNDYKLNKKEISLIFRFAGLVSIVTICIMYFFFCEVGVEHFSNFYKFAIEEPVYCTLIFSPIILVINVLLCYLFSLVNGYSRKTQIDAKESAKKTTKKKTSKKSTAK